MPKSKRLYLLMLVVTIGFIVYVVYINFIYDPQAAEFLSHKTNLRRPIHIPVWLNVMNVHVGFACLAMVSGLVNFSQKVQRSYRTFHRVNGYAYAIAVLAVVLTSGYMAPYTTGGTRNSMAFNLLNIVWPLMTVMAIVKIKKKQIDRHRKWMVRSYALCFTNMAIHLLTAVFHKGFGLTYATSYTIGIYGAIVLLFAAAEAVNRTVYIAAELRQSVRGGCNL